MKTHLSDRELWERTLKESDVLGAIRSFLELRGAHIDPIVERIPWGRKTSTPGIPDLAGRFPKRCHMLKDSIWGAINVDMAISFWIEVKRVGGKLRPAQAYWLEEAEKEGLIAFKADSVEAVIQEFKKRGINL